MRLKPLYATAMIIFTATASIAQTTSVPASGHPLWSKLQFQVGFNATDFIKQFLSFNDVSPAVGSPFLVNAKAFYRYRALWYGVRTAYGFDNSFTSTNTIPAASSDRNTTISRSDFRIGVEVQQHVTDRWNLYYGVDYVSGANSSETIATSIVTQQPGPQQITTVTTTLNTSTSGGWGPVLGVQFNLSKHICLSTEATLYFIDGKGGETTVRVPQPTNTTPVPPIETSFRKQSIAIPSFINFNVIF